LLLSTATLKSVVKKMIKLVTFLIVTGGQITVPCSNVKAMRDVWTGTKLTYMVADGIVRDEVVIGSVFSNQQRMERICTK
jgi:hypothetical protein